MGTERLKAAWKGQKKKKCIAGSIKIRELKAKTEKDCPYCGKGEQEIRSAEEKTHIPYKEKKSNRGRKKQSCTHGHCCPNPACYYYLVTDERIHALIGYGGHGKYEWIQDLYCQAFKTKFTSRKKTVLYRLKTLSRSVVLSLNLLVLGLDASALQELLGIRESTRSNRF